VARLPNVSLAANMSVRQAVWQTYISKGGVEAAEAIEKVARGAPLSAVLRQYSDRIHPAVHRRLEGDLHWHFLRMN